MTRAIALALALAGCRAGGGGAAPADGGSAGRVGGRHDVAGRVVLDGPAPVAALVDVDPAMRRACGHASHPDPSFRLGGRRGIADCVVQLLPEGGASPPAAVAGAVLSKRACAFEPRVLVVAPGTPVELRNDGSPCESFLCGGEDRRLPPGSSVRVAFDAPGAHPVLSSTRPWLRGYVFVASSRHAAVTGADGEFLIPRVPAGDYVAVVWHERLRRGVRYRVHVPGPAASDLLLPVSIG
jgi:plastocyanin